MTIPFFAIFLALAAPPPPQQQQKIPDPKPTCTASIRWTNGEQKIVPPGIPVVSLNLFSSVSKPADICMPAEIRLTVSYLDIDGEMICSGVISPVALQRSNKAREGNTQVANIDIRPGSLLEFARWRNGSEAGETNPRKLSCFTIEGQVEATAIDLGRAVTIQIRATVLPAFGGEATTEIRLIAQQ